MAISATKLQRFHQERSRMARDGEWSAEAEEALRRRLFEERPKIRMSDLGGR